MSKKRPLGESFLFCLLALSCLSSTVFPVVAHEEIDAHSCTAPVKPGRISSQWELEVYQVQLEIFERCMFEYIREQQKQAQNHENAAQATLQQWKDFIRAED